MDDINKAFEAFLNAKNSIVLFWEKNVGWKTLGQNDDEIDPYYYCDRGVFGLRELVASKDALGYDNYLSDIDSKMKGAFVDAKKERLLLEPAFSFNVRGGRQYYKLSTFLNIKNGITVSMLVRIEKLEPEESYRYRLARIITNDKNPESFNIEVEKAFRKNPMKDYAVVQFDIVGFKYINQQHGEAFGDEMLNYIINSLKFICNESQLFVRLTADVFMILTPYNTVDELIELINHIRELLQGYKGVEYRLVFGINLISDKSVKLRKYGDGAAVARQSIKDNALKYYAFYDENMEKSAKDEKWIENQMEKALANREFIVYLQPKFSISSNAMIGAEALVRWKHPARGLISPMEFIPLFEKNGFITKLDRYVWEEAVKWLGSWKREGLKMIPISVNMSRRNLQDDSYIEFLNDITKKYDVDKELLEIEITETINDDMVIRGIELLKNNGYMLLMDDFGSGFSSLNMLKDTRFDVLKIDREFLKDFLETERGKSIVKHTITMTREIGLDIIAEGVENKEQADFLVMCGCDKAQGFYYAKPVPIEEFEEKYHRGM